MLDFDHSFTWPDVTNQQIKTVYRNRDDKTLVYIPCVVKEVLYVVENTDTDKPYHLTAGVIITRASDEDVNKTVYQVIDWASGKSITKAYPTKKQVVQGYTKRKTQYRIMKPCELSFEQFCLRASQRHAVVNDVEVFKHGST